MEDNFKTTQGFKSYVNKPEVTALSSQFLVKGSKNVLIDYGSRVISRNGYTLYHDAATTGATGVKSSYDWETSTLRKYSLKVYDDKIAFDWNNTYNVLKTGLATPYLEFAKVWDDTEKMDVLLWVMGDTNMYKWSGGAAKIASSTSTTLTKQGVLTAKTTIAFVAGTPGTVAATITDSANGFVTAGFAAGDTLFVTGSVTNSRNFTIGSVTAGTITLIMTDVLVSEVAGPAITVHNGEATWAASRFLLTGTNTLIYNNTEYTYSGGGGTDTLTGVQLATGISKGTATITIATPGVVTNVAHGLVVGDAVQFTTTGALPTGLSPSTTYYVISAGLTADNFELALTSGGAAINTSGTQSGVHTLLKVSFPTAIAGDPIWQKVVTLANPGAISAAFKADLIAVQLNQVILASTKSQEIYGSKNNDYTNFTLTSPRAPADPFKLTMDNYCTCIVPIDNAAQTTSSLMFGAGTNEFFQLSFQLSQDNLSELPRMIKLKTANGSGVISKGAITNIKNSVAYISREPTLDTFSNLEANNIPISDPIKNDFDTYDFTGSHVKYWKRAIYISVPTAGIVLIYDLMRKLWQPPQTIPVGRFSIINDWLYGHSSINNETYKLFTGTDDNGVYISQVARFAYNNGGRRDRLKNMSEFWTDGYITANGTLNMNVYYGFEGIAGMKTMTISGGDSSIVNPLGGSPLGNEPLGTVPLGGSTSSLVTGLPGTNATMLRFWQEDTASLVDYTEFFTEYRMDTLGGQFAIVSYGTNQVDASTSPVSHKK